MADAKYSEVLDIASSTILLTGGSSGIGLGLARCFVNAGAQVLITGRREQQLKEAVEELNSLGKKPVVYRINDVGDAEERLALYDWIIKEYPQTNILINNAGVQQRHPFILSEDSSNNISWQEREKEIQINISAPIHLSQLFISHFRTMKTTTTAIMTVSSGLAFLPAARMPIYCATKAAIHSFSLSLRYQLKTQYPNIQVYEIIPPAVQTNLGGSHAFGEPLDEYCQATFARLVQGEQEIGYKYSDERRKFQSREDFDQKFLEFNDNFAARILARLQQ